jgi:hypothetical protein
MSNIDTVAYSRAGRVYTATNVSAKILTVVGTAMTGLILYNPVGSGKLLSFLTAGFSWGTVSPSAQSIGIAISPTTITVPTSNTAGSAIIKSATGASLSSVASAWDTSTLGTACIAARWFGGAQWVTGGTGQFPYMLVDKIDGELGLIPGAAAAFCMIGGTGPTGMASLSYIEVDL